jgi:hypothetical protein
LVSRISDKRFLTIIRNYCKRPNLSESDSGISDSGTTRAAFSSRNMGRHSIPAESASRNIGMDVYIPA